MMTKEEEEEEEGEEQEEKKKALSAGHGGILNLGPVLFHLPTDSPNTSSLDSHSLFPHL